MLVEVSLKRRYPRLLMNFHHQLMNLHLYVLNDLPNRMLSIVLIFQLLMLQS